MAKKLQETLCAHTRSSRRPLLCRNAKSFLVSNLASTTLCVLSLSLFHSFIYIHFLIRSWPSSNTTPFPLSLSPHFCMPRVEENTPTVYLALHSACTAQHKRASIKVKKKPSLRFQPAIVRECLRE